MLRSIISTLFASAVFLPYSECVRRLHSEVLQSSNSTAKQDRSLFINGNSPHRSQNSPRVETATSPKDHLVENLPLLATEFPTQHWAGHLPASGNNDKYFFYWLFAPSFAKTTETFADKDIPLIIWLNGGPACSSMDGLFVENGPLRLVINPTTGAYEVVPAPVSWHMAPAYTLYIDQPVGTGLSFTSSKMYPRNDKEVNKDFSYFLQSFFKLHSDKFVDPDTNTVNRKLYFSGESYAGMLVSHDNAYDAHLSAGHYIPSMMNHLLKRKDELLRSNKNHEIIIPVRGGAIGNGWVDPFYQYSGAEFAYGLALIDWSQVVAFREMETKCQAELNKGHYNVGVCFSLIDKILDESHGSQAPTKASGYDVRLSEKKHSDRDYPPGHKVVETYLGGWNLPSSDEGTLSTTVWKDVLVAIHATAATPAGQKYKECTDPPYHALSGNDGLGVVDDVIQILEHSDGVELLFFNGVYDIICNHVGNERFLERMQWSHNKDWITAERYAWFAESAEPGKVSGYMKEFKNLKFLKIMDAGHMVPMDVPGVSLDMMKLFVHHGSFRQSEQHLAQQEDHDTCPLCPTCKIRDSGASPAKSSSSEPTQNSSKMGRYVISYAWLVALAGLFAFCVVMLTRRRASGHQRLNFDTSLPDEVELNHSTGGYKDEPSNGHPVI